MNNSKIEANSVKCVYHMKLSRYIQTNTYYILQSLFIVYNTALNIIRVDIYASILPMTIYRRHEHQSISQAKKITDGEIYKNKKK